MRRSEAFFWFSLVFTVMIFAVYRSPPVLYLGLIYSIVVFLARNSLGHKETLLDGWGILGTAMLLVSPVFLAVRFGEYPSPAAFHALILIGLSLLLFRPRSTVGPNSIAIFEAFLAAAVRSRSVGDLIAWLSDRFVDVTSYLVRGLIDLFNVPITMNGNVAVVRDTIVVVGSGCSGLDAFTLYILASLLLIYLRKSNRNEALLLLAGALGIIPLNALRIFSLLVIGYHSGISFLELFHSHLGDLMFVAYVFLYWWWVTGEGGKDTKSAGLTE